MGEPEERLARERAGEVAPSSSSLALRPARVSDAPDLAAIRRDAILGLATAEMGEQDARDWANSAAADRVLRAIDDHEVWVAEHDAVPVGWIEIHRDRIEGAYVRPDLARGGIGSALLLHAESRIRSAGHASAALDASPNAERFYLRRGYEPQSEGSVEAGRPMVKPLRDRAPTPLAGMRLILITSSVEDEGVCEGEAPAPAGRRHAESLASHLSATNALTYGPAPRDDYGWEFVVKIGGISFAFVLQAYGDREWLVPFRPTLASRWFRRRGIRSAVEQIEEALASWKFGPPNVRARIVPEEELSDSDSSPSQFYSGLVAELYEPLAAGTPRADDYVPFLDRFGTPALELACGSGLPLLDLLERGYQVEGLDASRDMLDLCRSRAEERGLAPTLHLAAMQSFQLPGRYRSIFLAGASFTLLTTDEDAASALRRIYDHLEPGGHALIPLEIEDPDAIRTQLGRYREVADPSGDRLRVAMLELDVHEDGRSASYRLRYERIPATGEPATVERIWERRWWTQEQFRELASTAGFADLLFLAPTGGLAKPDASIFVALARRS